MRHVTQHLNGGIQQPLTPAGQAADQPQRQADASANRKADYRARELMARCCHSSPLALSDQNASTTPSGEGKMRLDSQPVEDASCQTRTMPTGRNHGAARSSHFVRLQTWWLLSFARLSRNKRVRHGFALQLKLAWLRNFRDSDIRAGTAVHPPCTPPPDAGSQTG